MAWAQPGSVLRQSRSTRPSWSVPSSSMSRCVLAVLVKELMPESIVKIFLNVGMMQELTFHSFHSSLMTSFKQGNTPSWRPGSMKLQELRELRHDWAKEQMSRVFLAKLTRKMLKHWMFYKSVWSWSSNLDDSCVKTLQKSVTLFHKKKPQVHWNITSHPDDGNSIQVLSFHVRKPYFVRLEKLNEAWSETKDRSKWCLVWTASRGPGFECLGFFGCFFLRNLQPINHIEKL